MDNLDLDLLSQSNRLLFTVPLRPVQGDRFRATTFPTLGSALYQTCSGQKLLVESVQSMANRLEQVCWNEAKNTPVGSLEGISHVTVTRNGRFFTDSMLEPHRINSPYMLEGQDLLFVEKFKAELGLAGLTVDYIDRQKVCRGLFRFDVGSLIHGVFIARKDFGGGRIRFPRALSGFIEASGVQLVSTSGVKKDRLNPSGDRALGFGNVLFSRDEYTADQIHCYINLDLAQIRGYGLEVESEMLIVLLSLFRIRKFLDGDLRLRTDCDLEPMSRDHFYAVRPEAFRLPSLLQLELGLKAGIEKCRHLLEHHIIAFDDAFKKRRDNVVSPELNEGEEPVRIEE